eukprot:CAMPEP_0206475610 /NCGR_PEP_ID=MMETSP0324_2-20121206/34193_1 /ASSEMBLY_ACC=CAM_ASM_000836 /TAXON_ID=2866 /ORGANISM="Crypthecodinium cohnii, Strain Seligo" /LENGTH=324 /DNA_ID=CAMNT_0053951023 /DNA_START=32 /DNA_END=1003 /DNA_ORIENTATION=-
MQHHDAENPNGLPVLPPPNVPTFGDSSGPMKLYGAITDEQLRATAMAAQAFKNRKRLDCCGAISALLVPWAAFVAVSAIGSFQLHYSAPVITLVVLTVLAVASLGAAISAIVRAATGAEKRFYGIYMPVAVGVCVLAGCLLGDINFWQFMQPSYQIDHLATYTNVDPSRQHLWSGDTRPANGGRYQDAGKIYFSQNARLDLTKAASFKDGNLYCVAPVVDPDCKKNCGYDFWAVGMNCCSDLASDFRCGDFNSTHTRSGLRQVVNTWRPFFRLAVVQAEGMHGIQARHPLFFHWVEDPVYELQSWKLSGYKNFMIAMVLCFFLN